MMGNSKGESIEKSHFFETSKHLQAYMLHLLQLKSLLFRPNPNLPVPGRENTFQSHYYLPRWRLAQAPTIRTEDTCLFQRREVSGIQ